MDPAGDDSNDGLTAGTPKLTITSVCFRAPEQFPCRRVPNAPLPYKAMGVAVDGDTLYLAAGNYTYSETQLLNNSIHLLGYGAVLTVSTSTPVIDLSGSSLNVTIEGIMLSGCTIPNPALCTVIRGVPTPATVSFLSVSINAYSRAIWLPSSASTLLTVENSLILVRYPFTPLPFPEQYCSP